MQDPSSMERLAQDSQRLELEVKGLRISQSIAHHSSLKKRRGKLELLQGLRREITVNRRGVFSTEFSRTIPYDADRVETYGRESSTTAQSLNCAGESRREADKYLTDVYLRDDKTEKEEGVVAELFRALYQRRHSRWGSRTTHPDAQANASRRPVWVNKPTWVHGSDSGSRELWSATGILTAS